MRRSALLAAAVLAGACVAGSTPTSTSPPSESSTTVLPTSTVAPVTSTTVERSNPGLNVDLRSTELVGEAGEGWRLIHVEGPRSLSFTRADRGEWAYGRVRGLDAPSIATSEWALDRLWERVGAPRPVVDFERDVVIALSVAVPGLCTDASFEGLVIRESAVFGLIDHEPAFATLAYYSDRWDRLCNTDTYQVTFYVEVARELLPDSSFTLHAENPHGCADCYGPSVFVYDLEDTTELDADLFGPTEVRIYLRGVTPPSGRLYMVFNVQRQAGYLISRGSWHDFRAPEQFTETGRPTWFEAFVTECEGEDAPNDVRETCLECDGDACDAYKPVGEVCRFTYEPVPLNDTIVTLTFDGTNCSIEVELSTD